MPVQRRRLGFLGGVLVLATGALAACGGLGPPPPPAPSFAPEATRPLTNPEILAAHSGKTLYGRYIDGGSYIEYHAPDGRVSLLDRDGSLRQGTWTSAGSRICYTYWRARPEASYCFEVRAAAEGQLAHFFTTGTQAGQPAAIVIRALEGNTSDLRLD